MNIEVVYNQMLNASGISSIEPKLGEKFDEQRHIAIGLEYGTKYPDNTVFRVIRKGYLLENNVIRPAEVIIIKKPVERKVIEAGVWDRFFRWIKPAKPMFAEINRKIVELEHIQTEKIDKITLDMESLKKTVHDLESKTKQTDEFERIQTEKIDKIAQNIEFLRNMIHELDGKAKQPNESERIQTEKIDKIPWM
jgi:molecular chaperone GrpE